MQDLRLKTLEWLLCLTFSYFFQQNHHLSDLHPGGLLEAASQLALRCHWLVLEVCLLVRINGSAVSMLDALTAARLRDLVGEGVAGLRVLHLTVTVHRRHLVDLD